MIIIKIIFDNIEAEVASKQDSQTPDKNVLLIDLISGESSKED